jgi:hypothetical protein
MGQYLYVVELEFIFILKIDNSINRFKVFPNIKYED